MKKNLPILVIIFSFIFSILSIPLAVNATVTIKDASGNIFTLGDGGVLGEEDQYGDFKIEGIVSAKSPTSVTVSGKVIKITAETELKGEVKSGDFVRVEGVKDASGNLIADRLEFREGKTVEDAKKEIKTFNTDGTTTIYKEEVGKVRITVKDSTTEETISRIELRVKDGKIELRVREGTQSAKLKIDGDSIVELLETEGFNSVKISVKGNLLIIEHEGISASTKFPVNVDLETNIITITTPAGELKLAILPSEAVLSLIRNNVIDESSDVQIDEEEGKLVYLINGTKQGKLFNLFTINFDVEAVVGGDTGENLRVSKPLWARIFDFLIFD